MILKLIELERDFFYLDVLAPFNTKELPWRDLSYTNVLVPSHLSAASVRSGANNDTLFLYRGFYVTCLYIIIIEA